MGVVVAVVYLLRMGVGVVRHAGFAATYYYYVYGDSATRFLYRVPKRQG